MPFESRKKSFYCEVAKKTVILVEICVCPDGQRSKKSEQFIWFTEQYLLKLFESLNGILLARVLSGDTVEGPKNVNEVIKGAASDLHMLYSFKKKAIKQYVLTHSPLVNIHHRKSVKKLSYSGGSHKEYQLFPEKLVVYVSLEPIRLVGVQPMPVTAEMVKAMKEKSKYFNKNEQASKLTLAAMKKQTNLRSIVSKMKNTAATKDQSTAVDQPILRKGTDGVNHTTSTVIMNQQISSESASHSNQKSCKQDSCEFDHNSSSSRKRITQGSEDTSPGVSGVIINNHISNKYIQFSDKKSSKQDSCGFDNTCSSSRKRLRKETDGSEDTGSESQHSEKGDDFVVKRLLSRKKRPKCFHKDTGEINSENNELARDYHANTLQREKTNQILEKQIHIRGEIPFDQMTISTNYTNEERSGVLKEHTSITDKIPCVVTDESLENACLKTSEAIEELQSSKEIPRQKDAVVIVDEKNEKEHETITIRDVIPSFDNVKDVSDLTDDHMEYLVQKIQKKLKNIFKGKEYCRRHEDFKRGGKSKGDLAFQVRFGLYSDDQHEAIMSELMSIFCARHNKYIDYISKVLLPEAFVLIYMEVFGGKHDDVERKLMGIDKKRIDSTVTDGSSTE